MKFLVSAVSLIAMATISLLAAEQNAISPADLKAHVQVLASDSLEGREVGEPGEQKAAEYISGIFERAGLEPKGTEGYLQLFEFIKNIEHGSKNRLIVNGTELILGEEWLPMPHSASADFSFNDVVAVDYGIVTEDSSYNDYEGKDVAGKAVLIKRYSPDNSDNPHVNFSRYESFTNKILTAIDREAVAILFVTPSDRDDTIMATGVTHVTPKDIPIIFLRRGGLKRLKLSIDNPELASVSGTTELIPVKDTGYNVIGYLPAATDTAIVIGAHFDHLGWGAAGSRYLGKEKKIHYGADDNASGTAGLLELAEHFASNKNQIRHSLLFAAFSGEEAGILGSSFYVDHPTIDTSKIRMMLNMDMIGRLRDQESGLAVFGTGTAAEFQQYFDTLKREDLKIAFREPGTGPSDHTAFYNNDIPVLHFFTGAHQDYHKPDDTWDKLDYEGTAKVVTLAADIVQHFDRLPQPLTFQKTKDPDAGKRASSFSVTLGIMPDYVADVKGVKVDGVSSDRPGERAGIQKGDVIIRMGTLTIDDIYAYMNALSRFRKGDSTIIAVERGADTLNLPVIFE